MPSKRCTRCQRIKPLEQFSKDPRNKKDGHYAACKPCHYAAYCLRDCAKCGTKITRHNSHGLCRLCQALARQRVYGARDYA